MKDTIYTRALIQAAEIEGGTQALASELSVPEPTLMRWMAGTAQTPVRAFVRLLRLVMDHEMRGTLSNARSISPQADAQSPTLTFQLGPMLGRCERCHGTEFTRAVPNKPLMLTAKLVCVTCHTEVLHGDLLAQLAKDAVLHSKATKVRSHRAVEQSRARTERAQQPVE